MVIATHHAHAEWHDQTGSWAASVDGELAGRFVAEQWGTNRFWLLYMDAISLHTNLTSKLLSSHFLNFKPQYSHVSDFTPNFPRNSHKYVRSY